MLRLLLHGGPLGQELAAFALGALALGREADLQDGLEGVERRLEEIYYDIIRYYTRVYYIRL